MKTLKFRLFTLMIVAFFISCSSDNKRAAQIENVSKISSDILLENSIIQKKGGPNFEKQTLTLSGKNLLNATATLKITNQKGEEVSCVSYPAVALIHQEYRTANSTLKKAHIREVVQNYFIDDDKLAVVE